MMGKTSGASTLCHRTVSGTIQDATCHAVAGAPSLVQIFMADMLCAVAGF